MKTRDYPGNVNGSSVVNDLCTSFKGSFVCIVDKHAPLITKKVRGLTCPWMNGSIKREIRQREFLLNKARRSNLDEDWSAYRRSRNRVTKLVRDSKSKYSRELIDENSDNPKKFWKTVKQIMPGQKAKRVTSIDVNGTQIYDDKEIANSFNNFFTKTVDRLVQVFGRCLPSARSFKFLMSGPSYTFRFEEVSVDFIRDQLKKLKTQNQKSCWT